MQQSDSLGSDRVGKLLFQQALPAAIGFMVMSVNMVVDTFYVGKYIGDNGIGAVGIAMPISFLISSFGMAVGIGGASIVSRALGAGDRDKAQRAFNNQVSLTTVGASLFMLLGFLFKEPVLKLFGAQGNLMELSDVYYSIMLAGIPFLTGAMMANSNLRAEGKARLPMLVMIVISLSNILFDHILVKELGWGMTGAGWATSISYMLGGSALVLYYLTGKTELKIMPIYFKLERIIVKEIFSIGVVSFIRQASFSVLTIVLHHSLFHYGTLSGLGGEKAISIYSMVSRVAMFAFFPLIGISQGMMPIVGYNYGAKKYDRVKETVNISLISGFVVSLALWGFLVFGANLIPTFFSDDKVLLQEGPEAIFWIFLMTPILIFQLAGATYYQAIGKGLPAMMLTLTKQVFFLLPIVLVLPIWWGIEGVWISFPIADVLAAAVCAYFLLRGVRRL